MTSDSGPDRPCDDDLPQAAHEWSCLIWLSPRPEDACTCRDDGYSPRTAPIIVAAELRRLAADLYRRSDNVPLGRSSGTVNHGVERVGDLREAAERLLARAHELDGGAA